VQNVHTYDPSAAYERGQWIVSHIAQRFGIAHKRESHAQTFATMGEAFSAAEARNAQAVGL
jgi:hypothetical protein